LCAGRENDNLPNGTAGQDPYGQVGQVGQDNVGGSATDMHGEPPPDVSLDDVIGQARDLWGLS
jgi:hypothetical protein